MTICIWDTYVKRKDGRVMHFDILVEDIITNKETIISYGTAYLKNKPFKTEGISTESCKFCHIEQASEAIINDINTKGFSIIEMEFCD